MAEINTQSAKPFLEYKGRPLVRCGKTLYYGNLYDDYVVMMQVVDTVPFKDQNFAGKIIIQLLNTDPNAAPTELVIKKTDTRGLYNAIDIASVWLDTALDQN